MALSVYASAARPSSWPTRVRLAPVPGVRFIADSMSASRPSPRARSSVMTCAWVTPAGRCLLTKPSNKMFVAAPRILGPRIRKLTEITLYTTAMASRGQSGLSLASNRPMFRLLLRRRACRPPFPRIRPSPASDRRLLAELGSDDLLVERAGIHQLPVAPDPGDAAGVKDDDLVGVHDRADPLRDHDHGGILGPRAQGMTEAGLGGDVQGREAVIEQVEAGTPGQGPGDGQPLALTTGNVGATRVNRGVQAPGHARDKVESLRDIEHAPQLIVGHVRGTEPQVVADGTAQQERLLRHQPD